MEIRFKKLILHNFMSFKDAEVNLDIDGFVSVIGENKDKEDNSKSNGSGKSSLISESIVWCLTGETLRGSKEIKLRGSKESYVTLIFFADDNEYEVTRGVNKGSYLTIIKNGEDISGKGVRSSEEILQQEFPDLNMTFLSSAFIIGQGMPNRFSSNTPSGRKEILEKLFKADFMIADIKDRVTKRSGDLKNLKRCNEDRLAEIGGQIKSLNYQIDDNKLKFENIKSNDELENIINKLNLQLNQLNDELKIVKDKNSEIEKYNSTINSKIKNLSNEKYEISNSDYLVKDIEEVKKAGTNLKSELIALRKEITEKDNITDICPTCGQKIEGIEKPDTSGLKEIFKKKDNEIKKLAEEYKKLSVDRENYIKARSEKIQEKIDSFITKPLNDYSELELNIKNIEKEKTHIESELAINNSNKENIEKTIKNCEHSKDELAKEKQELDKEIFELDKHLAVVSKISSMVNREFRGYLLTGIIDIIDKYFKENAKVVFNHDNVSIEQNKNNIDILFNDKSYESLSGGEARKVDICLQLALREALCIYNNISFSSFVIDEAFDNLDYYGTNKIIDLIVNNLNIPTIFIISHHSNDLEIPYDSRIAVIKKNKISEVRQVY